MIALIFWSVVLHSISVLQKILNEIDSNKVKEERKF